MRGSTFREIARELNQPLAALSSLSDNARVLLEKSRIEDVLRRHRGNAAAASEALGMAKKTLYDKLHRLNLAAEDFR